MISVPLAYIDERVSKRHLIEARYLVAHEAATHLLSMVRAEDSIPHEEEAVSYTPLPAMLVNQNEHPGVAAEYALALHVKLQAFARAGILQVADEGQDPQLTTSSSVRKVVVKRPRFADEVSNEGSVTRALVAQRQWLEREATYVNAQRKVLQTAAKSELEVIRQTAEKLHLTASKLESKMRHEAKAARRLLDRFAVESN